MPANPDFDKYAPTAWGVETEDLECPSGQLCLVRRIDPMQLIASGALHKTDMLTAMVDQKHVSKKAKGGKNSAKSNDMSVDLAVRKALADPTKMRELVEIMDAIVIETVVRPQLLPVPEDPMEKIPGKIYIDSVAAEDKAFIMNYAFAGTRDVARFRRQLGESVDSLANVESMESSSE